MTKKTSSKSTKKTTFSSKPSVKTASKPVLRKLPTPTQMKKLRNKDQDFTNAQDNTLSFLEDRQAIIGKVAKSYYLDGRELYQEAYEVLLTCLRDYTPAIQKTDGSIITVKFNTFFSNRIENRAKEIRNDNPEYKARLAFTEDMDETEKQDFRKDPPLLVQHLDYENNAQEGLTGEASFAHEENNMKKDLKIKRDSHFDKTLSDLIAREVDEKKKATLLQVKVGGIYSFQDIAVHFGVTDSRASQVMNELIDAFYTQRIIDNDAKGVLRDLIKLKFNEKRVVQLVIKALQNIKKPQETLKLFSKEYKSLKKEYKELKDAKESAEKNRQEKLKIKKKVKLPAIETIFTSVEDKKYPLIGIEMRKISDFKYLTVDFHPPSSDIEFDEFWSMHIVDDSLSPIIINQDGYIIDGVRRVQRAKQEGITSIMCVTRQIDEEHDAKLLRVALNLRSKKPTKLELYYGISALAEMGMSQKKIADHINTSRTNVLVYAKVREKASPHLKALFEDELIQVTNASLCCDELDSKAQKQLAIFIRTHGVTWSKGSKFNKLYQAALKDEVAELSKQIAPEININLNAEVIGRPSSSPYNTADTSSEIISSEQEETSQNTVISGKQRVVDAKLIRSLEKQVEKYQQALTDTEVWAERRETVITKQTEELSEAIDKVSSLKKEINANELMQFGSKEEISNLLKGLKQYYALTEHLNGAIYALEKSSKEVRKLNLSRKQSLEVAELIDTLEQNIQKLRVINIS